MDQRIKVFRVFIASPGDLGEERKALREVVEQINNILSLETDLRIELMGWEDTMPGGGRPQELINVDLDKADLFVGCLWQRWGTPAGKDGKTGFEEEFTRSAERFQSTGSPEIWLFFKELDNLRRDDPGEKLKKVLKFRSAQIEAKQFLFKEFKETREWRDMLNHLLLRHVLRLVSNNPAEGKAMSGTFAAHGQTKAVDTTDTVGIQEPRSTPGFSSLQAVLRTTLGRVNSGKLLALEKPEPLAASESIRLLIFAAANFDWHELQSPFGVHETNSAYSHRESLILSVQEQLFLLRTHLLDESRFKPGWYWVHKSKLSLNAWMLYFVTLNADPATQEKAVQLATRIKFPLVKSIRGRIKPISLVLRNASRSVRMAGIQHLAMCGSVDEIHDLRHLLISEDRDERAAAEETRRIIRMRVNPDRELRDSIQNHDSFNETIVASLVFQLERVADETLFLALQHPDAALRLCASQTLVARGIVTDSIARQMIQDESIKVRECGYLATIRNGGFVDFLEVQNALKPSFLNGIGSFIGGDATSVIQEACRSLPLETLWRCVYSFEHSSPTALRALGKKYYNETANQIRAEVTDAFSTSARKEKDRRIEVTRGATLLPTPTFSLTGSDTVDSIQTALLVAGLEILADRPRSNDRKIFLGFIENASQMTDVVIVCLRGIANCGKSEDVNMLVTLLDSPSPKIQMAATRAILSLSTNLAADASDLLEALATPNVVWAIIDLALMRTDDDIWPSLECLLCNEDDNVRRWTSYYAVKKFSRRRLLNLLRQYLTGAPYYYDVVTILDRAIYAPHQIKHSFLEEERANFVSYDASSVFDWSNWTSSGHLFGLPSYK